MNNVFDLNKSRTYGKGCQPVRNSLEIGIGGQDCVRRSGRTFLIGGGGYRGPACWIERSRDAEDESEERARRGSGKAYQEIESEY